MVPLIVVEPDVIVNLPPKLTLQGGFLTPDMEKCTVSTKLPP
jgi:hypothetical protein